MINTMLYLRVSYCMYFYQHIGKSTCIRVHASLDSSYDYAIFVYQQLVESNRIQILYYKGNGVYISWPAGKL